MTLFAARWFKEFAPAADHCVRRHIGGGQDNEKEPRMSVMMSWARSTLANVEHSLARTDRNFDRLLVGVVVLLAVAIALLFFAA